MKVKVVFLRILLIWALLSGALPLHTPPTSSASPPTASTAQNLAPSPGEQVQERPAEAVPAPTAPAAPLTNGRRFTQTIYASKDTYIYDAEPTTNYGDSQTLIVKYTGLPNVTKARTLLYFDLTDLPSNAVALTATLELYWVLNQAQTVQAPADSAIYAHSVDSAWDEMTLTWETRPATTYRGDPPAAYVSDGWTRWDVTNIVSGWLSGDYDNHGIQLSTGLQETAWWYSRELTTGRPRLVITYQTEGSPMMLPAQKDTWVNQALPSTNYGDGTYLRVGRNASTYDEYLTLLWFDPSDLPTDTVVISATLEMYSEINRTQAASPARPSVLSNIWPDAIHTAWDEMTVTWNNKPM